jgi:hypothetical protein
MNESDPPEQGCGGSDRAIIVNYPTVDAISRCLSCKIVGRRYKAVGNIARDANGAITLPRKEPRSF